MFMYSGCWITSLCMFIMRSVYPMLLRHIAISSGSAGSHYYVFQGVGSHHHVFQGTVSHHHVSKGVWSHQHVFQSIVSHHHVFQVIESHHHMFHDVGKHHPVTQGVGSHHHVTQGVGSHHHVFQCVGSHHHVLQGVVSHPHHDVFQVLDHIIMCSSVLDQIISFFQGVECQWWNAPSHVPPVHTSGGPYRPSSTARGPAGLHSPPESQCESSRQVLTSDVRGVWWALTKC